MSMHNHPCNTSELIAALKKHGLKHDAPSQLADGFRSGWLEALRARGAVPHTCFNGWFVSLPDGRQAVLRADKWMLANAAYEAGRAAAAAPAAPISAPALETMTLQEVWEAAGGNPIMKPTREDVLLALRLLDQVCDDVADAAPQPPAAQFIGELVEHRPVMDVVHNAAQIDQETAHRIAVALRAMRLP